MQSTFLILLCCLLSGCGASIKTIKPTAIHLSDYNNAILLLETQSGAISLSQASLSGLTGAGKINNSSAVVGGVESNMSLTHAMPAQEQVILAAKTLSFELTSIGFNMVDTLENANMIILFSIGTVRFDPVAGWIADQAFLQFKEKNSGRLLCSLKAETRFITPTVKTIINRLVGQAKKIY